MPRAVPASASRLSRYVEDCSYDAHVADTPFVPMCASQRYVELG